MNYIYLCFIFLIGTILGSFYGVVGTRLPKGDSIVKPSSHCTICKTPLKWYELIPIISYIFQRGKCRNCHTKLSYFYPMIELGTGILFAISYAHFGFSYSFFISLILSSLLIIIFVTDIKYMIILDSPLILSTIIIFLLKWIYIDFKTAIFALIAGAISFLFMLSIGKLGDALFKRESLGGGDIKLAFLFGLILGIKMSLISLALATFLALPYAVACLFLEKNHEVPFGPFLISSLWIVFFFYEKFENILLFLTTI